MLAAVTVGSFVFIAIKVAREELGPVSLFLLRNDLAALLILISWIGLRPNWSGWTRRILLALVVIALLRAPAYQILLNVGATGTNAALMAMLVATIPLHVSWMGAAVLGEHLNVQQVAGIALAFAGAVLPLIISNDVGFTHIGYPAAIVIVAMIGAVIIVMVRAMSLHIPAWDMTSTTLVIAAVLCLPMHSPGTTTQWSSLTIRAWCAVVFLVIAMFAHTWLMFSALKYLMAASASLYQFVGMLLTGLWGWLLLGEQFGWTMLTSAVLIAAGLTLNARQRGLKRTTQYKHIVGQSESHIKETT